MPEKKAKLLSVCDLLTAEQQDAVLAFAFSLVRQNTASKTTPAGTPQESNPTKVADPPHLQPDNDAPPTACFIVCSVCGKEVNSHELDFHVHSTDNPTLRKGLILCGKCGKWMPESFMRWHFYFEHTPKSETPESVPQHMLRSGGLFNRK
jgi:hypothetical protein